MAIGRRAGARAATAGPEFDRYAAMLLNSSMLRNIAPLSLALVMLGCGDKSSGTDSEGQGTGSGSDGESTTVVVPTSGATDAEATAGGMSDGVSETGVPPDSTTGPDATTGGSGSPELMSSCMDACAHIFECVADLPGTIEDCMGGCLDQWGGAACGQAGIDLLECLAGMNCKQVEAYVNEDKAGVCAEAADAADAVCGGTSTCSMGGSAGMNECSVSRECDGVVEELQCDGTTCTCVVDGEPGESCPDEGVCAQELDGQMAAAVECCGFAW